MEGKKGGFLRFWVMILVTVLFLHQTLHLALFGGGISGFSIGESPEGNKIKNNFASITPASRIILIIEWSLLVAVLVFSFIRNKMELKKEVLSIDTPEKYKKTKKSTDIDILYNILKEKKHLRLSTISKVLKMKEDKVLDWAKTLESASLVKIDYPRMGEPEIKINE